MGIWHQVPKHTKMFKSHLGSRSDEGNVITDYVFFHLSVYEHEEENILAVITLVFNWGVWQEIDFLKGLILIQRIVQRSGFRC